MTKVIEGSGNVFADIGLPNPEEHLAKARLVVEIHRSIGQENLSQAAVAKKIGISQPEVSKILRGHFRDYSLDKLFDMLNKLGRDVTITVGKRTHKERAGKVLIDA